MSKFLVETYYTCTFKIIHELEELNENVYNIALKIADNSPNSIKAYKDLYAAAQNNGLKKGLEYESNTSYDIPEVEERMRNFLTKLKS